MTQVQIRHDSNFYEKKLIYCWGDKGKKIEAGNVPFKKVCFLSYVFFYLAILSLFFFNFNTLNSECG